jgi:hypothetical protein
MESKKVLAIEVTETQRETIRHLFAHHEWDFNEVDIENNSSQRSTHSSDEEYENPVIPQSEEDQECEHCLCKPCITAETNRQDDPKPPNKSNSRSRKDLYKRFWTMLFHRNVWRDPRYVQKKQRALQQDPQISLKRFNAKMCC